MTDIHAHVLPGLDDGALDINESVQMLRIAARDGTVAMVATPHCNLQFAFDPDRTVRCAAEIRKVAIAGPALYTGCELHLTPENLERVLDDPNRYTLNGGDCLLLELPPAIDAAALHHATESLLTSGVHPVIAHPERNYSLSRDMRLSRMLVDSGCYMQLTGTSLLGAFGEKAKAAAMSFLKARLVHFVASDTHGAEQRRPMLSLARAAVKESFGAEAAKLLFSVNGMAALSGEPVRSMPEQRNTVLSWAGRLFRCALPGPASVSGA